MQNRMHLQWHKIVATAQPKCEISKLPNELLDNIFSYVMSHPDERCANQGSLHAFLFSRATSSSAQKALLKYLELRNSSYAPKPTKRGTLTRLVTFANVMPSPFKYLHEVSSLAAPAASFDLRSDKLLQTLLWQLPKLRKLEITVQLYFGAQVQHRGIHPTIVLPSPRPLTLPDNIRELTVNDPHIAKWNCLNERPCLDKLVIKSNPHLFAALNHYRVTRRHGSIFQNVKHLRLEIHDGDCKRFDDTAIGSMRWRCFSSALYCLNEQKSRESLKRVDFVPIPDPGKKVSDLPMLTYLSTIHYLLNFPNMRYFQFPDGNLEAVAGVFRDETKLTLECVKDFRTILPWRLRTMSAQIAAHEKYWNEFKLQGCGPRIIFTQRHEQLVRASEERSDVWQRSRDIVMYVCTEFRQAVLAWYRGN